MKGQITFLLILLCLITAGPVYGQAKEEKPAAVAQKGGPNLDIILVLDNSGSMKKNDPEFLTREVVTNFLYGVEDPSRLGLIIFDKAVHLLEPLQALKGYVGKTKFQKSLDKVTYSGQLSDSPAAIERALYELKTNGREAAQKVIILLTDGIVDTGNPQKDLDKERWLKEELAMECKKEKIRIFGIAFTDAADFSLIQALAFKTGGEYFRAFKADEIHGIFDKINKIISKPRKKPILPAVKAATPRAATSVTAAPVRKALPLVESSTVRESNPPPTQKENRLLIYILGALSALLGLIVVTMTLSKKSRALVNLGIPGLALRKASPMPRAELVDVKNITSKKTFRFEKRTIRIGRDANNDIAIPRDTVSSSHANIEYREASFYLEDQRSKNKTFLNGEEISPYSPQKLKNGDVISFNVYKFIFLLPDLIPAGKTVMDFGTGAEALARAGGPGPRRAPSIDDIDARPQAILVDIKNVTSKKTMILDKKITKIGRGVHNDVDIPQTSVSGSHAIIEYKNGYYYLEDQRSRNKTYLNGETIGPHSSRKLKSGDEITFDAYKFIFLLERQTPAGDTEESL